MIVTTKCKHTTNHWFWSSYNYRSMYSSVLIIHKTKILFIWHFWDRVLRSSGWPWIHHLANKVLMFWSFCPTSKVRGLQACTTMSGIVLFYLFVCLFCFGELVYMWVCARAQLEIKPRASFILGKHSTNCGTFSGLTVIFNGKICNIFPFWLIWHLVKRKYLSLVV